MDKDWSGYAAAIRTSPVLLAHHPLRPFAAGPNAPDGDVQRRVWTSQAEGGAQTSPSAWDPMGSVGDIRCECRHKGSSDANAGLQVPCSPASSLERVTGIEPEMFSLGNLLSATSRHVTCHQNSSPWATAPTPRSHVTWAASSAAGAGRCVMPTPHCGTGGLGPSEEGRTRRGADAASRRDARIVSCRRPAEALPAPGRARSCQPSGWAGIP